MRVDIEPRASLDAVLRPCVQVESYISKTCVCAADGLGLTAEFGLDDGAVNAADGHRKVALFELMGDQPHPELGGGRLCLLQMQCPSGKLACDAHGNRLIAG
jgi:hypothetical protein